MNFKAGQTIGVYKLRELCGSGAYGNVFYAENTVTHQFYALKVLNSSETINERELRGLMNYRDCRHPNLLQIHHIDKIDGMIYYTMDAADNAGTSDHYIPDTLSHRLSIKKTLSAQEILKMANELLDGLSYLHKHGLVHRDIKPDNILWIDGKATLADIGLTAPQKNASLVGTPDFMSDDLLHGKRNATPEDDLYSLGKVIYCALTGCPAKEYPHYPADVTISDAAQIIRTYTTVCDSSSPIKSSEEMKSILNSGKDHSLRKEYQLKKISGLLVIFLIGCTALLFFLSRRNNNLEVRLMRKKTSRVLKKNDGKVKQDRKEEACLPDPPKDARIISEMQLLYEHRTTQTIRDTLKKADQALLDLEKDVDKSIKTLKNKKMTKDAYILAEKAILQAREEHLAKDPLCRLALQERKIQIFLKNQSTQKGKDKFFLFRKMLNQRDAILYELSKTSARNGRREVLQKADC